VNELGSYRSSSKMLGPVVTTQSPKSSKEANTQTKP